MIVYQDSMLGGPKVATGNAIRDQLAEIMQNEPETRDDEDLLAAHWLILHANYRFHCYQHDLENLADAIQAYRKADIRRRRQELRHLFPYSPEEERRRQKRAKGGPPG